MAGITKKHLQQAAQRYAMVKKQGSPSGFTNISTTYQLAYQTYDGNVQVRKIGDRLWEVLPRGGASLYEKSKQAALERAFQLSASTSARRTRQKGKRT